MFFQNQQQFYHITPLCNCVDCKPGLTIRAALSETNTIGPSMELAALEAVYIALNLIVE